MSKKIGLIDKGGVITEHDAELLEKVCEILEDQWNYDIEGLSGHPREYTIAVIEATKEALSHEH
jgi:hypothetical protein